MTTANGMTPSILMSVILYHASTIVRILCSAIGLFCRPTSSYLL